LYTTDITVGKFNPPHFTISAIALYTLTGAYMFAALYCLFLVMAFVGLVRWMKAHRESSA